MSSSSTDPSNCSRKLSVNERTCRISPTSGGVRTQPQHLVAQGVLEAGGQLLELTQVGRELAVLAVPEVHLGDVGLEPEQRDLLGQVDVQLGGQPAALLERAELALAAGDLPAVHGVAQDPSGRREESATGGGELVAPSKDSSTAPRCRPSACTDTMIPCSPSHAR